MFSLPALGLWLKCQGQKLSDFGNIVEQLRKHFCSFSSLKQWEFSSQRTAWVELAAAGLQVAPWCHRSDILRPF